MIGVIGGTGLGEALFGSAYAREVVTPTPFGPPSSPVRIVAFGGADVAVIARHGEGHLLGPSAVPYRANLFALKTLGVTHLLVSGAVGSLREDVKPRDLVVVDQVIDRTYRRVPTFFDEGMAVHVELAHPYCAELRQRLVRASGEEGTVHARGTYVCIEGPSFSSIAESNMHREWGADVVGMTALPEARLAREAEMCCALVAFATDYDCWRTSPHETSPETLLAEIMGHVKEATDRVVALLRATIEDLGARPPGDCSCRSALALGIWSRRDRIPAETVARYGPLVSKYLK